MNLPKDFNPGQNNQYIEIHLGPYSQYLPNVTELTIINGDKPAERYSVIPETGIVSKTSYERVVESEPNIDLSTVKSAILKYVSRIAPKLKPEYMQGWERLWTGILDLDVIECRLCDISKQQGTTFNRQLICKIIHYLSLKGFYKEPYKASDMTRALEGDDQPSIRTHALNLYPDAPITHALDNYLNP